LSYLKINVRLTKRGFFVLIMPYLTASTWYYLFRSRILVQILERIDAIFWFDWANVCFYFSIVFSIFVGIFYVDEVEKIRLIYTWAAIMPIAMILLIFAQNLTYIFVLVSLLGWLFGTGLLAYSVYFCNLATLEERGRVGGTVILVSLLSFPMFLSLSFSFLSGLLICVFLGISTFIIQLLEPREKTDLTTKKNGNPARSSNKPLYYFIPWLIFCVINGTLANVVTNYMTHQFGELVFQAQVLQYITASFGALMGGLFADWVGRRMSLSIGLISYGIGAALTGLARDPLVCMFSAAFSGLTWGMFLVLYTLVIWGDFASKKACALFYATGFIPFYFFEGIGYLVLPKILHISAMYAALVSSFLIFLSNVPIIFAKELLPPDITEKMHLGLHIRWIKKFLKKQKSSKGKD